jgi:hypothetical protein
VARGNKSRAPAVRAAAGRQQCLASPGSRAACEPKAPPDTRSSRDSGGVPPISAGVASGQRIALEMARARRCPVDAGSGVGGRGSGHRQLPKSGRLSLAVLLSAVGTARGPSLRLCRLQLPLHLRRTRNGSLENCNTTHHQRPPLHHGPHQRTSTAAPTP